MIQKVSITKFNDNICKYIADVVIKEAEEPKILLITKRDRKVAALMGMVLFEQLVKQVYEQIPKK